jgi:hypothetical protein
LTGLGEAGLLTVVGGFEGRTVPAGCEEPLVVVPVDVVQGGEFDLLSDALRPAGLDQFGLVQADDRFAATSKNWAAWLDELGMRHFGAKAPSHTANSMLTFRDRDNIQPEFLWRAPRS